MTPEQLDNARWDEAIRQAPHSRTSANPAERLVEMKIRVYRQLVVSNWQPTPKPSPRVLAMRDWLINQTHYSVGEINRGHIDQDSTGRAFLAGYATAMKAAEPLLNTLVSLGDYPALVSVVSDYLKATGDE